MAGRVIVDLKSGATLVFPDVMNVSVISEESDKEETHLVIDVNLVADKAILNATRNSRQIALGNVFFSLYRPADPDVLSFQFMPTGYLTGRVILSVKTEQVGRIKRSITTSIRYFEPEYSGRTEEYFSSVELAKVRLSALDIESIRTSKGFVGQIKRLIETVDVSVDMSDREYALQLSEKIVTECDVQKIGGGWHLTMPPGTRECVLSEIKEVVSQVSGDSNHMFIQ